MTFNRRDLFLRFLNEELDNFRIHLRRVRRDNEQRNYFCRLRHVRLKQRLSSTLFDALDRKLLRRFNLRRILLTELNQTLFNVTQDRKTGLCIVEHVPGLTTSGLHRLHVVLDAHNHIRETIGFFLVQYSSATRIEHDSDQAPDTFNHFHRARLVEHQQSGFDAVYQ